MIETTEQGNATDDRAVGASKDPRLNPHTHVAVMAARHQWNARLASGSVNRKITTSFDDMLDMFCSTCMTMVDIGTALGVTNERVRQVYNSFFRSLFVGKSARQRRRVCTLTKRSIRIAAAEPRGAAGVVASTLRERGFDVRAVAKYVNTGRSITVSSKCVTVNDRLVRVHVLCNSAMYGARHVRYFHFRRDDAYFDTAVIYAVPLSTFFIIPRFEYMWWDGATGKDRYIPEKLTSYRTSKTWVWQWKERWDLLGEAASVTQ